MTALVRQTAFNRGELDPALSGRNDWQSYFSGAKTMRNMIPRIPGGAVKRGGTEFVAYAYSHATPSRLIRFQFSSEQTYILEFNERRFRIIHDGGLVVYPAGHANAGQVVSLVSPFTADQMSRVQVAQKEDVMIMTHPDLQPRILSRYDHHDWRFSLFTTGVSLAAPGNLRLTLDGRNGARYVVSSFAANNEESLPGDVVQCGTPGQPLPIPNYANITVWQIRNIWESYGMTWPVKWQWELYQTQDINQHEMRTKTLEEMFGYQLDSAEDWTIHMTRPDGTKVGWDYKNDSGSRISINTQINFSINHNWGTLVNVPVLIDMRERLRQYIDDYNAGVIATGHSALSWSAVGAAVRYRVYRSHQTADGQKFYPIGETTGTTFDDDNRVAASVETPQVSSNPFSGPGNYPAVCAFYQQRLILACTNNKPNTVWGSRIGAFRNFNTNAGDDGEGGAAVISDTSAFEHTIDSGQSNEILWAIALGKILFGTGGGEVLMYGPGGILSATSVNAVQQSNYGCYRLAPEIVGQSVVAAGSGGYGMRAYLWDYTGDSFRGKSVSLYSSHLFNNRQVVGYAYQHGLESVLWVVMSDGALLSLTYMDEEEVQGWARHDTADGKFEAVANMSSNNNRSEIYVCVVRRINGVDRRCIERMKPPQDAGDAVEDAWYVDCGLEYSGVPVSELSGLGHLQNKNVVCLGDGHVIEGLRVTGGRVTLPFEVSKAVVGLPFTAELETMEMEPSGGGDPLAPASKNPVVSSVYFYHSRECLYGHPGQERAMEFRGADEPHPEPIKPKTIRKNNLSLTAVGDNRASLRLASPSPVPFGVLSAEIYMNVGDINAGGGRAY